MTKTLVVVASILLFSQAGAAPLHWSTLASTPTTGPIVRTELRRCLLPGRTLDSLFTRSINTSTCLAYTKQVRGVPTAGYRCGTEVVGPDKDYLYLRRDCGVSVCLPWGPMEQLWLAPMAGLPPLPTSLCDRYPVDGVCGP